MSSTEGVAIFSLDNQFLFDPFELTVDVTPDEVKRAISNGEYSAALIMALQLNQSDIICDAFLRTPVPQRKFLCLMFITSFDFMRSLRGCHNMFLNLAVFANEVDLFTSRRYLFFYLAFIGVIFCFWMTSRQNFDVD